MGRFIFKRVAGGILLFGLAVVVFGFGTMYLWNWLMPALFAGAVQITFIQALGLVVLSKILFGGMHFRGRGWRGRCGHGGHHWKHKWDDMTPEEREKMREKFQSWCGKKVKVEVTE